jgi:hypothetical protein
VRSSFTVSAARGCAGARRCGCIRPGKREGWRRISDTCWVPIPPSSRNPPTRPTVAIWGTERQKRSRKRYMWGSPKSARPYRLCASAGPNFQSQKRASQGRLDQSYGLTACGCGEVHRLADRLSVPHWTALQGCGFGGAGADGGGGASVFVGQRVKAGGGQRQFLALRFQLSAFQRFSFLLHGQSSNMRWACCRRDVISIRRRTNWGQAVGRSSLLIGPTYGLTRLPASSACAKRARSPPPGAQSMAEIGARPFGWRGTHSN